MPTPTENPLLVHVRFDLMHSERPDDRVQITRANMPCVPLPGELVNLRGNPYRVVERGWAVDDDTGQSYAFVRVR